MSEKALDRLLAVVGGLIGGTATAVVVIHRFMTKGKR